MTTFEKKVSHATSPRSLIVVGLTVIAAYVLVAYIVIPALWTHHERQPGLGGRSMVTRTADSIPGDPLNVGLVGAEGDLVRAMQAAGWYAADPVTVRSSLGIIDSVLLDRPDFTAPVSPLFYDGRREDLAYERPGGASAKERHHVRFWKVLNVGAEGRPVWLGSATFDRSVGFSADTGQVTHHISPDIDAERDFLTGALQAARMVDTIYQVSGVGPTLNGRNGEGNLYRTDGEIRMLALVPRGQPRMTVPIVFKASPIIEFKDATWRALKKTFGRRD